MHRFALTLLTLVVLVPAVPRDGESPAGTPGSPGQQLLEKRRCAEALPVLEEEIKADPANPSLLGAKVAALLCLRRFGDAERSAKPDIERWPALRLRYGDALFARGRAREALQAWLPLRTDRAWSGEACPRMVRAMVALGMEREARRLQQESSSAADLLGEDAAEESLQGNLPAHIRLTPVADPPPDRGAPRKPRPLAPSARASGPNLYSDVPVNLSLYTDLDDASQSASFLLVTVPVTLEGAGTFPMALDSGTGALLLSPDVAKRSGAAAAGSRKLCALGLENPLELERVLVPKLVLGPLTLRGVPALVLPEGGNRWKEVGGVLPLWLLRHYGVRYDRRQSRLTLFPPRTSPEEAGGEGCRALRNVWVDGRPFVEAEFQGEAGHYFLLSTAANHTYLQGRQVKALGVRSRAGEFRSPMDLGHLGTFGSWVAGDVDLRLGRTPVRMPTARVLEQEIFPGFPLDCSGALGRDILDLFAVFLDYGSNTAAIWGYGKK